MTTHAATDHGAQKLQGVSAQGGGVVIVSPGGVQGSGGMASVTRTMADWWRQAGFGDAVHVLDPRGRGAKWLFPFYFARSAAQLVWLRLTRRPDVLHLQISERGSFLRKGLLLYLGRALGMQVVLHHHGAELIPFYTGARPLVRRMVSRIVRSADLNIVLGDKWSIFLVETVGVDPARVVVQFNATPRSSVIRTPGAGAGPQTTFLVLAVLLPRKGISEFLAALAALKAEGLPVRGLLAGSGDMDRYKKEAAALGLGDACVFLGWVDRAGVDKGLAEADAMVLPSYEEGLPMAILESLSAGVPVVATRVGSIPEVLADGQTALLVDPKDVPQLTDAMRRIATDKDLGRRLAEAGQALFARQFEMDAYMGRISGLYRSLRAAR